MIFDAGVFISLENPAKRGTIVALVQSMLDAGVTPATNVAALAQAWCNPSRQVPMAMLVKATTVHPFGDSKTIGLRCAASGTSDVVDASLTVLADQLQVPVLTTDPDDMAKLGATFQTL